MDTLELITLRYALIKLISDLDMCLFKYNLTYEDSQVLATKEQIKRVLALINKEI